MGQHRQPQDCDDMDVDKGDDDSPLEGYATQSFAENAQRGNTVSDGGSINGGEVNLGHHMDFAYVKSRHR